MKLKNLWVTILAAGLLSACGKKDDALRPAVAPASVSATNSPAATTSSTADFQKLVGKWQRPDGGYVLEIRSATAEGKLEAGYFNPNSINVARAQWELKEGQPQVFVELRDVNYPGSTYTLVYQPASDQLAGIYFQAAMRERFDVVFDRMK
jgi:hypothetical protein